MTRGERTPDALVIGGGAIGAAAALELSRRGAATVLVEAGDDVAAGCSYGNSGLVCPSHAAPLATPQAVRDGLRWMFDRTSPFYLRPRPAVLPWLARFLRSATPGRVARSTDILSELSVASLRLHREYADSGIPTSFQGRGILDVYEDEAAFERACRGLAARRADGLPADAMSLAEARRLVPSLGDAVAGGIFFSAEGHCDGREFVAAVARAAADAGATIRVRTPVEALQRQDGRIASVRAGGDAYAPGTVVLAAGAWSARLARAAGVRIPLEAGKGYHIDLEAAPSDPAVPVFMHGARVIATPLDGRLRLAGTLELAGLDARVDGARVHAVRAAAERHLRHLDGRVTTEVWAGLRPCPPDGLPIVGPSSRVANLVLATGHAMMGLAMAPITGRLVAEVIAEGTPSLDLAPLSPDRFGRIPGGGGR